MFALPDVNCNRPGGRNPYTGTPEVERVSGTFEGAES
jgi:hypothetical protein